MSHVSSFRSRQHTTPQHPSAMMTNNCLTKHSFPQAPPPPTAESGPPAPSTSSACPRVSHLHPSAGPHIPMCHHRTQAARPSPQDKQQTGCPHHQQHHEREVADRLGLLALGWFCGTAVSRGLVQRQLRADHRVRLLNPCRSRDGTCARALSFRA